MKKTQSEQTAVPASDGAEVNRVAEFVPPPVIAEEAKVSPAYDPFAPENIRLPQEFLDQAVSKPDVSTIRLQKPSNQEWIRVHPSAEYRHVAAILELTAEKRAQYMIHPSFVSCAKTIKYSLQTLYLYVTRQWNLGLK